MKTSAPGAEKSDISGPQLGADEKNLAVFRPDLDAELRFAEGLVVVTSLRVWFRDEQGRGGELLRDQAQAIDVERREHAGVCELFLRREGVVVWRCRYTLARARDAAELAEALGRVPDAARDRQESGPAEAVAAVPGTRRPPLS